MIRTLPTLFLLLLAACEPAPNPETYASRAERLQAEGQTDAALAALREGMRASPEDPELRLLLANLYLDVQDGGLALTAIEQALDRGLPPARAVLPKARALLAEGKTLEVLELAIPADAATVDRARLMLIKATTEVRRSSVDDGLDDVVTRSYMDLLRFVEQNSNDSGVAEVEAELANLRQQDPFVDRAWQHNFCDRNPAAEIAWRPSVATSDRVIRVGPNREITSIAAAARIAKDGDTVEIDPGVYAGDVALWPQSRLTVRGSAERPSITSNGKVIQDRDVWLFTGNDVVVENVEISGARSKYENGAGIRHTGIGLTLRYVYLHDNENGVLTGNSHPESNDVLIEFSEFARNGDERGFAHNIYVGRSRRLEMRYSYSHESKGGHLVKSRARENVISYNRLTDEQAGSSSYIIDIPEGGSAEIIGNMIEQGAETLNHGMISFAGEEVKHATNQLRVVNNSFYNRDLNALGVRNHKDLDVVLANNLFGGAPAGTVAGNARLLGNATRPEHGMSDPRNYNFSLTAGAYAIDRGVEFELVPAFEYVHPTKGRSRQRVWRTDVGAYERCGF